MSCRTLRIAAIAPIRPAAAIRASAPRQTALFGCRGQAQQLRRPHHSSGGSGGGRRAAALRTCAYLTRHKDDQLQRTVEKYVAAINAHDIAALCAVLAPKVVWSDRVWSRDDLLGHKKASCMHQ
jgi:hypothetical protein